MSMKFNSKFEYTDRQMKLKMNLRSKGSKSLSRKSKSERIRSKHSQRILKRRQFDYSIGLKKPKKGVKFSDLGYRPTFKKTKNFKRNKHNRVVHKKVDPEKNKMVKPKDFFIPDEMFIPGEEEGLAKIEQYKLKADDEKSGNYIERHKSMVQKSLAAKENFERVQQNYYIHSSRKAAYLEQPRHIIPHELVFKILKNMFPDKDFLGISTPVNSYRPAQQRIQEDLR